MILENYKCVWLHIRYKDFADKFLFGIMFKFIRFSQTCKLSASTMASYKFMRNVKHDPNVPGLIFVKFLPRGR